MDPETQHDLGDGSVEDALNLFVVETHNALRSHGKTPLVKEGKIALLCFQAILIQRY